MTDVGVLAEMLTGVDPERTRVARARLLEWGLAPTIDGLDDGTVDGAIALMFLAESVALLEERGVPLARLLKKLRGSQDVWPTWAEIRTAAILCEASAEPVQVEIEPGRTKGAHPDWGLRIPGQEGQHSVEVKAVGLSEDETAFYRRMGRSLGALLPRTGLVTVHATLDSPPPREPEAIRRHAEARTRGRHFPGHPPNLRASVVAARGSEQSYATRVASKMYAALRQLPEGDDCYVAVPWTNGAPLQAIARAIDWRRMPDRVAGLLVAGSGVAFPHPEIHCFVGRVERDSARAELDVWSRDEAMDPVARLVLGRFERSAGVRATLVRLGNQSVVARTGRRRLEPFNLLMDEDPPVLENRGRVVRFAVRDGARSEAPPSLWRSRR